MGDSNDFWSLGPPLVIFWHKCPPNFGGGKKDKCPPKLLPLPPHYRQNFGGHLYPLIVGIHPELILPCLQGFTTHFCQYPNHHWPNIISCGRSPREFPLLLCTAIPRNPSLSCQGATTSSSWSVDIELEQGPASSSQGRESAIHYLEQSILMNGLGSSS